MGSAFHHAVRRFAMSEAEHGSYRIGGGRYAERMGQQQEKAGGLKKVDELIGHELDSRLELLVAKNCCRAGSTREAGTGTAFSVVARMCRPWLPACVEPICVCECCR